MFVVVLVDWCFAWGGCFVGYMVTGCEGLRVGGVVFWLGGWWLNCALSVLGFGFIMVLV